MSSATNEPDHVADESDRASALRILVVDADDRTRESVVGILGIRHRFNVVGSAGRVPEAVELARAHHPQVVILDPRLPDVSDGMALIRRLPCGASALSSGTSRPFASNSSFAL